MSFFSKVAALSRDRHKPLHFKPVNNYAFAGQSHWLPVAGVEFANSSSHYVIVFLKEKENYHPVLVTGLELEHNQFVDDKGGWKENTYIPAFTRAYPFVLADAGLPDKVMTICIDEAYDGWGEKEGDPLFEEDSSNSSFLNSRIDFISSYHAEMKRTEEFAAELDRLGLIVKRSISVLDSQNNPFTLSDVFIVDEEKMQKLDPLDLQKRNSSGTLPWIFAHLRSLTNLATMVQLKKQKEKETA